MIWGRSLIIWAGLVLTVQAQNMTPPLVTTTGNAEIRVIPDLADLSFDVEVRGVNLAQAREEQSSRMKKILASLRDSGVKEGDLQTSQIHVRPVYFDDQRETSTIQFYSVSQQLSVTLHDLAQVAPLTGKVIDAGATGASDAVLRTSKLREHRDAARVQALRAAKEKAVALATELGVEVGKPYSITENESNWWGPYNAMQNVAAAGGGGAVSGVNPHLPPGRFPSVPPSPWHF